VHDRELDGFAIFEQGHGIELHVDALLNAFDHGGMEIKNSPRGEGDPQRCPVTLIWLQLRGRLGGSVGMNYS
jgi:hypothetical protein